jgi:hypothetical protein
MAGGQTSVDAAADMFNVRLIRGFREHAAIRFSSGSIILAR